MEHRWEEAQKIEKQFWKKIASAPPDYWRENIAYRSAACEGIIREFNIHKIFGNSPQILDIGCGPTIISQFLFQGRIVGIDPLMNIYYELFKLSNKSSYVMGLGEYLPFKDDTFDTLLCINVIDHTINPSNIFNEMNRILRNDGYVILSVNLSNFNKRQQLFIKAKNKLFGEKIDAHPYKWDSREFKRYLIKNSSFMIVEERKTRDVNKDIMERHKKKVENTITPIKFNSSIDKSEDMARQKNKQLRILIKNAIKLLLKAILGSYPLEEDEYIFLLNKNNQI